MTGKAPVVVRSNSVTFLYLADWTAPKWGVLKACFSFSEREFNMFLLEQISIIELMSPLNKSAYSRLLPAAHMFISWNEVFGTFASQKLNYLLKFPLVGLSRGHNTLNGSYWSFFSCECKSISKFISFFKKLFFFVETLRNSKHPFFLDHLLCPQRNLNFP